MKMTYDLKLMFVLLAAGCSANHATQVSQTAESPLSSAEAFVCTKKSSFPFAEALEMPVDSLESIPVILGDRLRVACWPYAVILSGVIGGERALELVKWFKAQRMIGHQGVDEFAGLTFVPLAVGYIAGGTDDETLKGDAVNFLIECASPESWAGNGTWSVGSTASAPTAVYEKLALACLDALSDTRSEEARSYLQSVQGQPGISSLRRRYATASLERFDEVMAEPTLRAYLLKTSTD